MRRSLLLSVIALVLALSSLPLEALTARLNGDYAVDIVAYDQVHDHILQVADLFSSGLIQQFPDRFS